MVRFVHVRVHFSVCMLSFATLCGIACSQDEHGSARYDKAVRFEHQQSRTALRERLNSQGLRFEELPDGTLVFDNPSDPRIGEAVAAVIKEFYGSPGAIVEDEESKQELVEIAAARGIGLRAVAIGNGFSLHWDLEDDEEVKAIIREFDKRRFDAGSARAPE
jgi:hypothetical protein